MATFTLLGSGSGTSVVLTEDAPADSIVFALLTCPNANSATVSDPGWTSFASGGGFGAQPDAHALYTDAALESGDTVNFSAVCSAAIVAVTGIALPADWGAPNRGSNNACAEDPASNWAPHDVLLLVAGGISATGSFSWSSPTSVLHESTSGTGISVAHGAPGATFGGCWDAASSSAFAGVFFDDEAAEPPEPPEPPTPGRCGTVTGTFPPA